jgi:hypothetical protein
MENWAVQLFWILMAFILGWILDPIKPAVRSFFQKSSLSYRNKRIKFFKDRFNDIREFRENTSRLIEFRENTSRLIVYLIRLLAEGISISILCAAILTMNLIFVMRGFDFVTKASPYIIALFAGFATSKFNDIVEVIKDTQNFEKYKEKTIKNLKRWGATLDEGLKPISLAEIKDSSETEEAV